MATRLPDEPRFHVIDFPAPLDAPPAEAPVRRPAHGLEAVTGGGLVALVDPSRGLHSLWAGAVPAARTLRLRLGDRPLPPAPGARIDGAGWERTIPLAEGGEVTERAALLDSAPALVLHWTLPEEATLMLELQPAGGGPLLGLAIGPGARSGGVAILPPGHDPERLAPRLHPPHARARARRQARHPQSRHPLIFRSGSGSDVLVAARLDLARTPLGAGPEGRPEGPFLLGIEDAEPRFARGAGLAEIGLGGLLAGQPELSWSVLASLLEAPGCPPLPTLHLAAKLAAWTAGARRLAASRDALDALADRLITDPGQPPAALPGPARVLDRLAEAIEPLGGDWKEALQARSDRLEPGSGRSGASDGGGGTPLRLPVLGGRAEPPPRPPPDARATLPRPEAFAPLDSPGLAPHRTLHAARMVRAWVEGVLAAEPDAAYGRLRLAPDLRGRTHLAVRNLVVGDARISFDCRTEGGACRLRLLQEGGRLPVNLVFEPRLPLRAPVSVRIGDERTDIPAAAVEGGVALSFQFPLDPERRIVVEEGG